MRDLTTIVGAIFLLGMSACAAAPKAACKAPKKLGTPWARLYRVPPAPPAMETVLTVGEETSAASANLKNALAPPVRSLVKSVSAYPVTRASVGHHLADAVVQR